MPGSVIREQLESLNIRVQDVLNLRSGRRDQVPQGTSSHPTSLYQWREVLRCQKCDLLPNSAACECRWNRTSPRKADCNTSAASALGTRSETAVTHLGVSRVGATNTPVVALPRGNSSIALAAGETTRQNTGAV
jgi:hypothetical protein